VINYLVDVDEEVCAADWFRYPDQVGDLAPERGLDQVAGNRDEIVLSVYKVQDQNLLKQGVREIVK